MATSLIGLILSLCLWTPGTLVFIILTFAPNCIHKPSTSRAAPHLSRFPVLKPAQISKGAALLSPALLQTHYANPGRTSFWVGRRMVTKAEKVQCSTRSVLCCSTTPLLFSHTLRNSLWAPEAAGFTPHCKEDTTDHCGSSWTSYTAYKTSTQKGAG